MVVVDAKEFARLRKLEQQQPRSFADHLLSMPKDDGEFERLNFELRDVDF